MATEALGHVRTVKAFASEPLEKARYDEASAEALRLGIRDSLGYGLTSALTGYLDLGAGVLILWYGGKLVLDGDESGGGEAMSIGRLVTFQLYWNMMNNSYQALQGLVTSFTRSAAAAEKVFALIDSVADIGGGGSEDGGSDGGVGEGPALAVDWAFRGEFVLSKVSFHYQMRPDNRVLSDLSLVIPGGSVCALVGRSGGGKSTIISMLMRFYDPRTGSISVDGRDLRRLRLQDFRRRIGTVAQDTPLFARSVLGNITYGLEPHEYTMEEVVAAAKKAQAHEFIAAMKDGYETRVGERGGRLSGGQRQRIAIARVFLRRPSVCLLDEATSALDEDSQAAVQASLDALIAEGGATVVLVAHRLSTVMNAHKIAVVDKGGVIEEGDHAALVAAGGVYAALVQKQTAKRAALLVDPDAEDATSAAAAGGSGGAAAPGAAKVGAESIDQLLDDIKAEEARKARLQGKSGGAPGGSVSLERTSPAEAPPADPGGAVDGSPPDGNKA